MFSLTVVWEIWPMRPVGRLTGGKKLVPKWVLISEPKLLRICEIIWLLHPEFLYIWQVKALCIVCVGWNFDKRTENRKIMPDLWSSGKMHPTVNATCWSRAKTNKIGIFLPKYLLDSATLNLALIWLGCLTRILLANSRAKETFLRWVLIQINYIFPILLFYITGAMKIYTLTGKQLWA